MADLKASLSHPNVVAWLRVIRAGESDQTDSAYTVMFGGEHFSSFEDHPRRAFKSRWGWTSAAGAYQAMCAVPGKVKTDTWGDFIRSEGPHDFSPESQDKFAVWCIKRRGALQLVLDGQIEQAIAKCNREWASLPGSPYGQPTRTLAQALAVYKAYGGSLYTSSERVEKSAESEPMTPFLLAALPSIIEAIPKLARQFGSGSEVSDRNLKAAELVAETVTAAVGAANVQEAVEKLKSDPAAVAAATKAIDGIWYQITEAGGGGIDGARKASAVYLQPGAAGFWLNPSFWISIILVAMPLMLLVDVLFVHPESYVGELRTQIVTGVLMVIGMVGGYWIGTSISSAKKDERTTS